MPYEVCYTLGRKPKRAKSHQPFAQRGVYLDLSACNKVERSNQKQDIRTAEGSNYLHLDKLDARNNEDENIE